MPVNSCHPMKGGCLVHPSFILDDFTYLQVPPSFYQGCTVDQKEHRGLLTLAGDQELKKVFNELKQAKKGC